MATRFSPRRNRFSPSVLPRRRGNIFDAFQRGADRFLDTRSELEDRDFRQESRERQASQEELSQQTGEAEASRSGIRLPGTTPIDSGTGLDLGGEGPRNISQAPTDELSIRDVFTNTQQRPVVATGNREEAPPRKSPIPGTFKRDVGDFIPGVGKIRLPSGAIIDAETTEQTTRRVGAQDAAISLRAEEAERAQIREAEAADRSRFGEAFVGAGGKPRQRALAEETGRVGRRTREGEVDLFEQFKESSRSGGVTAGERQGLAEIFFNRERASGKTFEEAVDSTNQQFPGSFSPSEARRSEERKSVGDPARKERRASIVRQLRTARQELDTPEKQIAVDQLAAGASKASIVTNFRSALETQGLDAAQIDEQLDNFTFFLEALPDEVGGPLDSGTP